MTFRREIGVESLGDCCFGERENHRRFGASEGISAPSLERFDMIRYGDGSIHAESKV